MNNMHGQNGVHTGFVYRPREGVVIKEDVAGV
jgi:hypothetical protein